MNLINQLRHRFFIFRAKKLAFKTYKKFFKKNYSFQKDKFNTSLSTIVHINTSDSGGGAARVAHDLYDFQNAHSLQSFMIVSKKKINDDCVFEINRLNTRQQHFLTVAEEELQWQDFFQLSSLELPNYSAFKKADIIHLHNLHGGYFSPFALPLISRQRPVVWSLHDMQAITGHCAHSFDCERWQIGCGKCPDIASYPGLKKDTTKFIFETKKKIYSQSNINIVVVSNWLRDKVKKSMLSNFPVYTIHNGINTMIYKKYDKVNARKILGIPNDMEVVLFSAELGVNNPFKGGEYVKGIIEKNLQKNILFINVGGAKEIEKTDWVWNIPYVLDAKEMAQYYSAADVYLYPTLAESFGLVILEAMACGLPVLTFNTGGVPELVIHNHTGYIAEYKNVEDLNAGLEILLKNHRLRNEMGDNAVRRVNEYFTLEIMNQNYLKLYNEILKS